MTNKPKHVKILTVGHNPQAITTSKIPKVLSKKVKVPYRCGELYHRRQLYGYYAYEY